MRRLGIFLLVLGFAWLVGLQLTSYMRVLARPIGETANHEIATMTTISRESAEAVVRRAILSSFDEQPLFIFPGFLMLVGGVLIARSKVKPLTEPIAEGK